VVLGKSFKDEVVYGEYGGKAVQGQEKVFGGVKEACAGRENGIKGDMCQVSQPYGHAPGLVSQANPTARKGSEF